jgi:lysophospholipase L1-like esterase
MSAGTPIEANSVALDAPAATAPVRGRFRTLGINAGVFFALVLFIELAARVLGLRPPGNFTNLVYDNDSMSGPWLEPSQLGFLSTPCFKIDDIHINRFGMRDKEREQTPKTKRIAMIGDSFTQGLQVADEDVASRKLEQKLAGKAEVLNVGVSSTGTSVQVLDYEKHVRSFHSDLVLLMFFVGNDISDNHPEMKGRKDPGMAAYSPYLLLDENGKLKKDPQPGKQRRTREVLGTVAKVYLGQWAYYFYRSLQTKQLKKDAPLSDADKDRIFEEAFRITEQAILRLKSEVEADNAKFGLITIPPDFPNISKTGTAPKEGLDAIRRLERFASENGLPILDLTPIFRDIVVKNGPTDFAYPCDGHWNPRGHEVAAEAIAKFIEEKSLL